MAAPDWNAIALGTGASGDQHGDMHGRTLLMQENVLAYGATGDGTTDDSAAINAALVAAAAISSGQGSEGTVVYLPPGHYKANIVIPDSNVILQGAGRESTIIQPASGIGVAFTAAYTEHVAIKNLTIRYATGAGVSFTGSNEPAGGHITFEDVIFAGCEKAVDFASSILNVEFTRCLFLDNNSHTINVSNIAAQVNTIKFNQCWFQGYEDSYINIQAVESGKIYGWQFTKCIFEGDSPVGSTATIIMGSAQDMVFLNCQWADFIASGAEKPLFKTLAVANGCPGGVVFIGCELSNANGAVFDIGNTGAGGGADWVFIGCSIASEDGVPPFTFGTYLRGLAIIGSTLTEDQPTWGTSNVAVIASRINGDVWYGSKILGGDYFGIQEWVKASTGTVLAAVTATGAFDLVEQTEPAAPAANTGRLFVKDTGGKSQLLIRFPSGASQVIATEP